MPIVQRQQTVQIHYRVDGSGERAWLLFNGATLPLEFWNPIATGLAKDHTVVRFDQRNAGATRADGEFTLLDTAADAAAVLEKLEIQRVIAVGHAWGGRVAQVFARDYPHLCEALVICGTGGQIPPTVSTELLSNMRDAANAGDKATWARMMRQAYCASGFPQRQPQGFAELVELMWPPSRPQAKWNAKISPSPSYWGITQLPTLMIYGGQDQWGTPANADDLEQRLADVRRLDIAEAGHFVVREAVDQVISALTEFANVS